jgi:ketol-acid reductoisomerase
MTPKKPSKPVHDKEYLRNVAVTALVAVAKDAQAPAAARAAASRTLLESLGDIGRLQETVRQAEKPLNEMNAAEVDREIARLKPKA